MFDIISDSACDLPLERTRAMNVKIVPFYVSLDGKHYAKEGEDLEVRAFYHHMVEHPEDTPKTSLPSVDDYMTAMEPYAKTGRELLVLSFTGKMSGGVGSARNAAEILRDTYPDAKITVHDTAAATMSEAIVVEQAVAMRDAGKTLAETMTFLEGVAPTNQILFTVGDLDYLIRGGRIGKVTGRMGSLLNIKPMIHFRDGEIFSGGVARGRQKSMEKAIDQALNYLAERNADPDDYGIAVGYGFDPEEGKRMWMQLRAALRAKYPASACEVDLLQIGCTIAVHTGPYPLGIGIMRRFREKA